MNCSKNKMVRAINLYILFGSKLRFVKVLKLDRNSIISEGIRMQLKKPSLEAPVSRFFGLSND